MPGAIADSSTLIHLSAIGRLGLLPEAHGTVSVPPAVWREVVEQGRSRPGAAAVAGAREEGWLTVESPQSDALVLLLRRQLDDGESEAIALAVEQRPDVLLLDELEARRVARTFQLPVSGAIGILIRAKLQGTVTSLSAELDRLRDEGGFWLSKDLYNQAIAAVGEGPADTRRSGARRIDYPH